MSHLVKTYLPYIITFAVIVFIGLQAFVIEDTKAQSSHDMYGFAWSDTIGWISFNCADTDYCSAVDYGVDVDSDGDMSGYAWSNAIGWISFNEADLAGCPSGTCKANLGSSRITGWARALSPVGQSSSATGGWDGWISLAGADYELSFDASNGNVGGYAWGSDVIGWIQPITLSYGAPVIEDSVSITVVNAPDPQFNMTISPSVLEMETNDSTSSESTITISSIGGYNETVTVTSQFIGQAPSNATINRPSSIQAGSSAPFSVSIANAEEEVGTYTLEITARGDLPSGETQTIKRTVILEVGSGPGDRLYEEF